MCCNSDAGCESVWPRCGGDVCVVDMVMGISLCWICRWQDTDLVCVSVSSWVVLLVGAGFHPKVWMVCVHCCLCE